LLLGTALAAGGLIGYPLIRRLRGQTPVFLARGQRYDGPLSQTVRDGLIAVGFDPSWVRGRRVLLKPNLVEPNRQSPHLTTHPSVVLAVAEVFLGWDAQVTVGEAPGHVRDTEMALVESGLEEALRGERLRFADLNYEETGTVPNAGHTSRLTQFRFPRTVLEADLIVSMPKLKTHHWAGMTASLKNLYGTLPGVIYGWPKNVLHHAGIPQTIVDIASSVPRTLAVVDAILSMEGDGPIMGTPKPMGLLAMGLNCAAVDATLARIIGLEPSKIPYLVLAQGRLGPIDQRDIGQRGEPWESLVSPFKLLDLPHLQRLRADRLTSASGRVYR
jgi:uncharacterized protein (DUF362 family)